MYVAFEKMPPHARIWIYQADRKINPLEAQKIEELGKTFIHQWTAHGQGLRGSAKLFHHQFLILTIDEHHQQASGCSIDGSVHFVQHLENTFGLNFLDRTKIAFLINNEIYLESLSKIKSQSTSHKISQETIMFNNLVKSKEEFEKNWQIPLKKSWINKYF